MKILFDFDISEEYVNRLKQLAPEAEFVVSDSEDKTKKEIVDSDLLFDFRGIEREDIERAENLKWIQTWTAGVDKFMEDDFKKVLKEKDIILTNMSGVHSNVIAEHSLGFMINFSRRFCDFHEQKNNKDWNRLKVDQLAGKTLAVVGLGSIGSEIARKAKVFEMNVLGVNRSGEGDFDHVDKLYGQDELNKALELTDYVVVIVPLTPETEGMIGEKEFAAMKESAYFINMARGEVVDEPAMIEALREGKIAGAGLDVFAKEPLPQDSPLYELDNVLITPHVGGAFPGYNKKAIKIVEENLEKFVKGKKEEMINIIDYNLGY
ncbi:MAG TPA: D-2-hydroxyacid dehydrogenase [Halanaerobiales bacterium]|nr:D-2-hydroxyacid dehydrogenase [Halanaerobiales bacterium]